MRNAEKATFAWHNGLYQFKAVPFGLAGSSGVFLQLIMLNRYEDFAVAYNDDILVFSKNVEEHFHHLEIVFKKLKEYGLILKVSFFQGWDKLPLFCN